ncbi:hypothetical protein, partial [Serratia marcescens]
FRSKKPSEFYIEFTKDDVFYRYELGVVSEFVVYEKLYRKLTNKSDNEKGTRTILILEREMNEVKYRLEELSFLDVILLKKNASIISTAFNYKLSGDPRAIYSVYSFFDSITTNVCYTGLKDYASTPDNIHTASKFYNSNEAVFEFVKKIIIDSD